MNYKLATLLIGLFASTIHAFEQLTSLQQLQTKITHHRAVLVKVSRDNCPPCRQLAPILTQFSKKYSSYTYFEVDSTVARDIVNYYNVNKVPTILYFYKGHLKGRDTGAQSFGSLEKRAKELLQ